MRSPWQFILHVSPSRLPFLATQKAQKLLPLFVACLLMMPARPLFSQNVIGKPVLDFSSKAPEVQQMQQYIDVPVSYFNGTPNISIPVHTITSKSITIPLTLQYHGGGIKVEDKEKYVGLGWSLKGIGSITRTVRGNEDEGIQYEARPRKYTQTIAPHTYYRWDSPRDSIATNYGIYGGWYKDGGHNDMAYETLSEYFAAHNEDVKVGNISTQLNSSLPYYTLGLSDPEPDLFYFDFGGYSGKFIFDAYRNPILMPYTQDIQITPVMNTHYDTRIKVTESFTDTSILVSSYFESFKISTPDGKDYYFGETIGSRIKTPYLAKANMFNAWYLTRIIDRQSLDTVYFEYHGNGTATSVTTVKNIQKFDNPAGAYYDGCINLGGVSTSDDQFNYVAYLDKIKTAKEEVHFIGLLDSIKVIEKSSGIPYKKIQWDYAKFNSGRRKLLGVSIKDLANNQFYPYTFNYYDPPGYKGYSAQDYWGYYNDASNNYRLMIGYPGCTDSGANRAPAWPAMKLDILTEITYPTGGKTLFEYEPHSAYTGRKLDNSIIEGDGYSVGQGLNFSLLSNLIGGVRIKSIQSYDPIKNDTLTKKFYYNVFGSSASSGHLVIPPAFAIDCSSFACNNNVLSPGSPTYLMSTHNLYQGSGTGSHVTYRNVTVQEEKNGVNNGRIEYEYYDDTNTDSTFYSNRQTGSTNFALKHSYDVYPDWQFRRLPENLLAGSEKEKRVYDASGQLLQKEASNYNARIAYGEYINIANVIQKLDICGTPTVPVSGGGGGGSGPQYLDPRKYGNWIDPLEGTIYAGSFFEEQIENYDGPAYGGRPLVPPQQSYHFFYRSYVGRIFVYKEKTISESYANPGGFLSDTTSYLYENDAHLNPTTVITRNSKSQVLTQQNLYAFDFNDVNTNDSTIYFMKKAFLNLPLAGFGYNNNMATSGAFRNYKLKSRQDSTIALPFEEYSLNSNTTLTATTLNLAGGYPKTLNLPLYNFQKEATFYYNPDNTVSHVTKKGNDKVAVLWDYNRLFAVAQAINADSADIAFTSFEAAGNGNWNIGSSERIATTAITGKKAYNLSEGNITRSGLNTAKSYIVSYWSASSAATVNSISAIAGAVKNGWTYFEHKLPSGNTTVTISGAVIIDELRLYPSDAQMASYSFDPLNGVTSANSANNAITYYEYDGTGRLRLARDADRNILKLYDYFFTGFSADTAVWRSAGGNVRFRPCSGNPAYNTDTIELEQVDINPNSPTYGTFRWIFNSLCTTCLPQPDWQNISAVRCKQNVNNENSGEQEQEQRDMNPCSSTYNQTRWLVIGADTTACPIPPPPTCGAPNQMMINGVCVTGIKVYTATVYVPALQQWECTYHYSFLPDCTNGPNYTEYKSSPCTLNSCTPL